MPCTASNRHIFYWKITITYDLLIIAAHPDDAEVQMGGTIAKLTAAGQRTLIVDLCDGEPADYATSETKRKQALAAADILRADRIFLDGQDRFIYALKKKALNEYSSIFTAQEGDQLLELYEAEDARMGRLFGVAYAEVFKSHSPLMVSEPTVFLPGIHG